jgi:hypothetical protein
MIRFSNSLPVQFWLSGEETFNEKDVVGITRVCWCHPWECADTIPLQFISDETDSINGVNANIPAFNNWLNSNLGRPDWAISATPTITVGSNNTSERLYIDYAFQVGKIYTFILNMSASAVSPVSGAIVNIQASDTSFATTPRQGSQLRYQAGVNILELTFKATSIDTRIYISVKPGSASISFTLNSFTCRVSDPLALPGIQTWVNKGISLGPAWTPSVSQQSVDLNPSGTTYLLYTPYSFIPGRRYEIMFHVGVGFINPSVNPQTPTLAISDDATIPNVKFSTSTTVSYDGGNSNLLKLTFVATTECKGIFFKYQSGSHVNVIAAAIFGTISTGTSYRLSIQDEDDTELNTTNFSAISATEGFVNSLNVALSSFCGKQIKFVVYRNSDGSEVGHTDCLSVKTNQSPTVLIEYANNSNFDGIHYDNQSPNTTFNLRIPAIFFHPENTIEKDDIELSNEEIVRLYDKIEEKMLLEMGFMPFYMRRKTLLALSHDFVTIDGREWIVRDELKVAEGNRHYPLKTSTILLTDKNFIKENQL